MPQVLPLASMHGEVHRFSGIIDRFGVYESNQGKIITVCVNKLRLVSEDRAVDPAHWWFRWRQEWAELYLKPGDHVCFTAKVKRQKKGYQGINSTVVDFARSPMRTSFGPSHEVRDLTVLRRKKYVERPELEKEQLINQLDQAILDKEQYLHVIHQLNSQIQALQTQRETEQFSSNASPEIVDLLQIDHLQAKIKTLEECLAETQDRSQSQTLTIEQYRCDVGQLQSELKQAIYDKHQYQVKIEQLNLECSKQLEQQKYFQQRFQETVVELQQTIIRLEAALKAVQEQSQQIETEKRDTAKMGNTELEMSLEKQTETKLLASISQLESKLQKSMSKSTSLGFLCVSLVLGISMGYGICLSTSHSVKN